MLEQLEPRLLLDVSFLAFPQQDVDVGNAPHGIVSADFNGDGRADLAVTNFWDDDVSVLYGLSGGGFGGRQDVGVGDGPYGIVSADFNGDGRADLAVTNWLDDDVSVLYAWAGGASPGDANGDGIVDGLDYVIWSNNYELFVGGKIWGQADFTGDGIVDGLDYVVWSNNYDPVAPAVASTGMVGDAAELEVAASAAAQLPESELVGEPGRGAGRRSSVAPLGPGVSAGLGSWASHAGGTPSESDMADGQEDGRDVPAWPVNRLRAAAPAGVPEEVEPALLTDTGAAGMRSPSHGLAALEDDLVDILGLVQLRAPLHA